MAHNLMLFQRSLPTTQSLFPLSEGLSSWTTFSGAPNALPFNDATLRPEKAIAELVREYTTAPDGKPALKIHYAAGSYKLSAEPRGGISFYAPGPASVNLEDAKEATFGYSVYFPTGFEFVKGGKLPGLYGGNSADESYSCSGGRKDTVCFSARLMWRTSGAGELYAYYPPADIPGFEANANVCSDPTTVCDDNYGTSLGRGNFTFPTGEWATVAERVRLNDAGQANGHLELFVDGKSVVNSTGLVLRDGDAGRIRGIQVQSFFGGSEASWATPKDQDIYLADFSVAIIEDFNGRRAANRSLADAKGFGSTAGSKTSNATTVGTSKASNQTSVGSANSAKAAKRLGWKSTLGMTVVSSALLITVSVC